MYGRLTMAAALAALVLGLVACSSGGGGSQTGTPSGPTQDAQVAALQAEINALRTQLGLAPDAGLGDSVAALQAEVKRLQDEAQARMDAEEAARDQAMAAEARNLAAVLTSHLTFFFNPGESFRGTATYGKPSTITATGIAGGNPDVKAEDSKLLGTLDGWSGTELMSTSADGSVVDVIVVYTNVEPDATVPFAEWAGADSGVAYDNGAVTVAAGNSALIAGAAFATASGSKTHALNVNTDADAAAELFQTSGTFGGASGTYTCSGDGTQTCTSAVASSDGGVILGGTGSPTWTFTPDSGATAKVADSSYQGFGWWLRKTDGRYTRLTRFGIEPGDEAFSTGDVLGVAGTATYTGPAVGLYSLYDSGPKGGRFDAAVEIKVDFGSATEQGTVSGLVSNFSDSAGTGPAGMDTWEVTLPETPIENVASRFGTPLSGATAAHRPVWTIDGVAGTPASTIARYNGYFYRADEGGTPQVVMGGFSAEYGVVGKMRGGYGATHSGP